MTELEMVGASYLGLLLAAVLYIAVLVTKRCGQEASKLVGEIEWKDVTPKPKKEVIDWNDVMPEPKPKRKRIDLAAKKESTQEDLEAMFAEAAAKNALKPQKIPGRKNRVRLSQKERLEMIAYTKAYPNIERGLLAAYYDIEKSTVYKILQQGR